MSTNNNGGPAFPDPARAGGHCMETGMTLRDYFAAQAMQSEVALQGMEGNDCQHIAGMAYEMADAMLLAREAMP